MDGRLVAGHACGPPRCASAGGGRTPAKGTQRGLSHGSGAHARRLGYVPTEQLGEVYNRSDCAIFPAAEIPLNQAKCSVKLATTLLEGVPVIASNVGEQARYGADGAARLVPAEANPEAFAQAVLEVLSTRKEQSRLVQRARNWLLSRYDWSLLGDELLAFYRTLLT